MNLYTITPYHGIDCDSVNGLNCGTNLEPIEVKAHSEEEAIEKALEIFAQTRGISLSGVSLDIEGEIKQVTGYSRADGENISEAEYLNDPKAGDYYTYEYVNFNKVTRGITK